MTASSGTVSVSIPDIKWKCDPGDPQDVRLRAALLDARRRLIALAHRLGSVDQIVEACRECLRRAGEEAQVRRYLAWGWLHQFNYEIIGAMSEEERAAPWWPLRAQAAEKIKRGGGGKDE